MPRQACMVDDACLTFVSNVSQPSSTAQSKVQDIIKVKYTRGGYKVVQCLSKATLPCMIDRFARKWSNENKRVYLYVYVALDLSTAYIL